MLPIDFKMELGTLNDVYNRIKNCRVVKPPYESEGYYSNNFSLDKRYGLKQQYLGEGQTFYDMVTIKGIDYYLYREGTKHFVSAFDGTNTLQTIISDPGFDIDDNSPIRLAKGVGIYGTSIGEGTVTTAVSDNTAKEFPDIPGYSGGYVKFSYTGSITPQQGDYILFTDLSSNLGGGINKIELIDSGNIYIIGTNARGSIPKVGAKFQLYKSEANGGNTIESTTLLVGHTTGVSLLVLDGLNEAKIVKVLNTKKPIIDIINFDGNIFVLTEDRIYFSRSTFNDNTQFYPLDYYYVDEGYKLFSMGKVLLLLANTNKLYAAANSTGSNVGYVGYDVNYNGTPFSKYSMIFDDQTIYIVQSDGQLKQIDITQSNATTYDLYAKDVLNSTRGLFKILNQSEGEMFINADQRFINFLYVTEDHTINFQYDKTYKHFIEQEYNFQIYKFDYKNKILCKDNILNEKTDLDIDSFYDFVNDELQENKEEYEQEINFKIDTQSFLYKPYIIRTFFGLVDNQFKVKLNSTYEIGGYKHEDEKLLTGFNFDERLRIDPISDDLLEELEGPEYNGTTVSIQSNLLFTGRFINFKYYGIERFLLCNSYIITDTAKTFINEPLLTN